MQISNFSKHLSLKRLPFLQCVFVISLSKMRRLHLCVFVSGSFIQLCWFAWIFCAGTMLFCYYNSVVYLKSSMAIFPAYSHFLSEQLWLFRGFCLSHMSFIIFSNYMKKDIGILMGILLNLYISFDCIAIFTQYWLFYPMNMADSSTFQCLINIFLQWYALFSVSFH